MAQGNETCPAELPNWCAQRHWSIFWILIVASGGVVVARILTLEGAGGKEGLPFFSANDRSRWITVRALVDHGTFAIDPVLVGQDGRQWDTIDKVRHVGRDGQFHYYSSKPPLLTIFMAAGYQVLKSVFGWDITSDTTLIVRALLLLVNGMLWAAFLWFVARMINSVPVRDWTRYYILGCAGFATFLGAFTITLNNHLPAAVCVMISLYFISEIVRRKSCDRGLFFGAGLMGAAAVANELPALAFLVGTALICLRQSRRMTLLAFLPPVLLVFALILASNWWAWGQIIPAYAQRNDGAVLAKVNGSFDSTLDQGSLPRPLRERIPDSLKFVEPVVELGQWPGTSLETKRWVVRDLDPRSVSQLAIVTQRSVDPSVPDSLDSERSIPINSQEAREYEIRAWGNWYDYPGSYWLDDFPKKSAIDRGEPSVSRYAFHLTFGHHGIFLLTPLWLLSFAGMLALIGGAKMGGHFQMRWLGFLALGVTVIVLGFYLRLPTMERNYGGVCCTPRWMLWLVPLWLMSMLPIVDWLGSSRGGKFFCFTLFFFSTVSTFVHVSNPWSYPWLYEVWHWSNLPS